MKAALQIFDDMRKQGCERNVITYSSSVRRLSQGTLAGWSHLLVTAACPQVEAALQIFDDMRKQGCERNVITYSSLISACEKAGQWQLAVRLFEDMRHDNCRPNVVTYNALLSACAQGGTAEPASGCPACA